MKFRKHIFSRPTKDQSPPEIQAAIRELRSLTGPSELKRKIAARDFSRLAPEPPPSPLWRVGIPGAVLASIFALVMIQMTPEQASLSDDDLVLLLEEFHGFELAGGDVPLVDDLMLQEVTQ